MDIARLAGSEPAGANDREDLLDRQLHHLPRCRRPAKQLGGYQVDALVGGLGGQEHRNQQGIGIFVVEGDRGILVELIQDGVDLLGFFQALHGSKGYPFIGRA